MRLKHMRELLKLSEEQMASRLQLSVERYHKIETTQSDQIDLGIQDDIDPPAMHMDMFNTVVVYRRLCNTSNYALQLQVEENHKLRDQNNKLKRALVRNQLTKLWSLVGGLYSELKFGEIDYRILELSGITRYEVDQFSAAIKEKFREDDTDMQL